MLNDNVFLFITQMFFFLLSPTILSPDLTLWVTWRGSYKNQEVLIIHEVMFSARLFLVGSVLLFFLAFCFVFVCFVCLFTWVLLCVHLTFNIILQSSYTEFVTRLKRWLPIVQQDLPTLPEHLISPLVFSGVFYVYVLQILFVLLSLFFWPLCCRSFFDLRLLFTPLVSSNSSYIKNLTITKR